MLRLPESSLAHWVVTPDLPGWISPLRIKNSRYTNNRPSHKTQHQAGHGQGIIMLWQVHEPHIAKSDFPPFSSSWWLHTISRVGLLWAQFPSSYRHFHVFTPYTYLSWQHMYHCRISRSSMFTGLCTKKYHIYLDFHLALIFHLWGFGDCTLQPRYAGREEIFSTLRGDENTHRDRL